MSADANGGRSLRELPPYRIAPQIAASLSAMSGYVLDQLDENSGLGVRLGLVLFPFAQGDDLARRYFRADLEKLGGKKVVSGFCKRSATLEYRSFQ